MHLLLIYHGWLTSIIKTDLFVIFGISYNAVLCLLSKMGHNIHKFPTAKSFACWLRLIPITKSVLVRSSVTGRLRERIILLKPCATQPN